MIWIAGLYFIFLSGVTAICESYLFALLSGIFGSICFIKAIKDKRKYK